MGLSCPDNGVAQTKSVGMFSFPEAWKIVSENTLQHLRGSIFSSLENRYRGNRNQKVLCHSRVIPFYGSSIEMNHGTFHLVLVSEMKDRENKDF